MAVGKFVVNICHLKEIMHVVTMNLKVYSMTDLKLRPYQEPISIILIKYLKSNKGKNPLIAMPTGSGKTAIIFVTR